MEMESHEENLSNLLYQVKIEDAKQTIKDKQNEIERRKKDGL
jgi:hypothetical protein